MKIERSWKATSPQSKDDPFVEITEDRAACELANAHGENAIEKLKAEKVLETRFGVYRITEEA